MLENTKGGLIAGLGVIFLFWAIIKVLGTIENSFNDIWGVKIARSLRAKFSDYLAMMLICPFLLIVASSATVMINSQVRNIIENVEFLKGIGPIIFDLLKLLPYCTIWLALTFVFIFMPNTKVRFASGLLAGVVAGTVFQITQRLYITLQFGVANYGAIYGSFAALPLFLIWLQISWLVVLFGAELSFAHQNVETYEFEQDCLAASNSFKKRISLLITHLLVQNFCKAQPPWDAQKISHVLEVPIRLVRQVLLDLVESGILCQVKKDDRDIAYQPAVDVSKISVKYVVEALEQRGNSTVPVRQTEELGKLAECLSTFAGEIEKSPANILLKDL